MSSHESSPPTHTSERPAPPDVIDLILALMERVHLLLIIPIVAGLLAWGATWLLPDYYKSEATINPILSVPAGVRSEDLILHPLNFTRLLLIRTETEEVRSAAQRNGHSGASPSSRLQLRARRDPVTGVIHLSATDASPEAAQAALQAAIGKLQELSRPRDQARAELESSVAAMNRQLARLEEASRRVNAAEQAPDSGLRAGELAIAQVNMVESELQLKDRIFQGTGQLAGLQSEAVIMAPTLPASADGPARTRIGVATWLITGLLLVMFILLREVSRGAQLSDVQLRRWKLIRQRFLRQ